MNHQKDFNDDNEQFQKLKDFQFPSSPEDSNSLACLTPTTSNENDTPKIGRNPSTSTSNTLFDHDHRNSITSDVTLDSDYSVFTLKSPSKLSKSNTHRRSVSQHRIDIIPAGNDEESDNDSMESGISPITPTSCRSFSIAPSSTAIPLNITPRRFSQSEIEKGDDNNNSSRDSYSYKVIDLNKGDIKLTTVDDNYEVGYKKFIESEYEYTWESPRLSTQIEIPPVIDLDVAAAVANNNNNNNIMRKNSIYSNSFEAIFETEEEYLNEDDGSSVTAVKQAILDNKNIEMDDDDEEEASKITFYEFLKQSQ